MYVYWHCIDIHAVAERGMIELGKRTGERFGNSVQATESLASMNRLRE